MSSPLLDIRNLKTYFFVRAGVAKAVDGVDLTIRTGETLALVGESGCGKSVTAYSILRLIPSPPGKIVAGEIFFEGENLLLLPEHELRKIRGNKISMVFQDPLTSLNPAFRIVSIIPGIDLRAPLLMDTSRGSLASPNFLPIIFSTELIAFLTWSFNSFGYVLPFL